MSEADIVIAERPPASPFLDTLYRSAAREMVSRFQSELQGTGYVDIPTAADRVSQFITGETDQQVAAVQMMLRRGGISSFTLTAAVLSPAFCQNATGADLVVLRPEEVQQARIVIDRQPTAFVDQNTAQAVLREIQHVAETLQVSVVELLKRYGLTIATEAAQSRGGLLELRRELEDDMKHGVSPDFARGTREAREESNRQLEQSRREAEQQEMEHVASQAPIHAETDALRKPTEAPIVPPVDFQTYLTRLQTEARQAAAKSYGLDWSNFPPEEQERLGQLPIGELMTESSK